MSTLGVATLSTEVDLKGLDKGLGKAEGRTKKLFGGLGGSMRQLGGAAVLGGIGLATGALVGLGAAFRDATGLAREQRDVERQLDQVLRSMGGAVGLTADEIKGMASELQGVTNFGDEAILAGQNLLLTFGNIGGEIFPQVTETMLDMSQALGQDMKSSAIQLGKALNDPVQGVTALSRVGVSFTEEQKEMIRTMAESGDVMGAQQVIMGELEKQFGGSARALADPAIQARNAWGDFKEMIGGVVLSVQGELAERAMPILQGAMDSARPIVEGISTAISTFMERLDLGLSPTRALAGVLPALFESFGVGRDRARELATQVMGVVQWFQETWAQAQELGAQLMAMLAPVTEAIAGFVTWKDVLMALGVAVGAFIIPIIISIVSAIAPVILAFAVVTAAVAVLRNAWENNWGGIQEKTRAAIQFVQGIITSVMAAVRSFWEQNGAQILASAQRVWQTIQSVVQTIIIIVQQIIQTVTAQIRSAWDQHGASILSSAQQVWGSIQNFISAAISLISNIIQSTIAAIQAFWQAHGQNILTFTQGIWDAIMMAIDAVLQQISTALDAFAALFRGDWEGFLDGIQELWGNAWEAIVNIIDTLWAAISPLLSSLWTSISTWFSEKVTEMATIGSNLITALADAISTRANNYLKRIAQGVAALLPDWVKSILGITSPSKVFMEIGFNVGEGLAAGIEATAKDVRSALETVTGEMTVRPAVALQGGDGLRELIHASLSAGSRGSERRTQFTNYGGLQVFPQNGDSFLDDLQELMV